MRIGILGNSEAHERVAAALLPALRAMAPQLARSH
jgi:hypothetical protein